VLKDGQVSSDNQEMSEAPRDPYAVLGVAHDVSDIELRRVYRGLVKRYHPDHNGGSAESAARFAQIQNAYDQIAHHRAPPQAGPTQQPRATTGSTAAQAGSSSARAQGAPGDPGIEDRIANLEREMAAVREAERRRRAEEQARLAREQARRPTPEELGYYTTDDSFTRIIDDAADQFTDRLRKSDARKQFARRLSDLFGRED
jgi:hypothetical protein